MIRLVVIAGIALTLVFALLVGGMRLQAQNEAVGEFFGECPHPCWQTVQPGDTARADALADLRERGWVFDAACNAAVYDVCYALIERESNRISYVYVDEEQVVQIALLDSRLTLAELMLAFGAPDYAAIPPNRGPAVALFTSLWFGGSGVSARLRVPCPANYADMLRTPASALLVWAPGTAMGGSSLGTMADLRRVLRQVCGT